jgi:hypothetical protein
MLFIFPLLIIGLVMARSAVQEDERQFYEKMAREEAAKLEAARAAAAEQQRIAAAKLAAQKQLGEQYLAMRSASKVAGHHTVAGHLAPPAGLRRRVAIPNASSGRVAERAFGHRAAMDLNGENPNNL